MRFFGLAILFLGATLALPVSSAQAQTSSPVTDRVEEDWELVISNPDTVGAGPQITTCMSPLDDDSSAFVAFNLNYRLLPSFVPGGIQIQVWSNKQLITTSSQGSSQCNTANETITWTQEMKVSNGYATYAINNGESTTWGKFGQGNGLLGVSLSTSLESMAGYDPGVSASHSGVSWQANHVSKMTLLRVRYYAGGQLITTDDTPRSIVLNTD